VPRYFTLQQAQATHDEVAERLRQATLLRSSLEESESELREEAERIRLAGGALVRREKIAAVLARRESAAGKLRQTIEVIQQTGCLVKDLDTGLLDFPTLLRGEEVYLCWKLGEPAISFWHRIEEGYRGRKPVDSDFLEHHRGED
jgi:hypothetical protein